MNFTTLLKPALHAVEQALHKFILPQGFNFIKAFSARLGLKLERKFEQCVHFLLIGHRPEYFIHD